MSDPTQTEEAFLQRVKSTLDERAAQLDANVVRDLRQARQGALDSLHKPRRIWQPVGLAAMLATLVIVVVSLQLMHSIPPSPTQGIADMALLGADDDFDLYENIDFYQWLELEKHNG
jgi:hypothetical protein